MPEEGRKINIRPAVAAAGRGEKAPGAALPCNFIIPLSPRKRKSPRPPTVCGLAV